MVTYKKWSPELSKFTNNQSFSEVLICILLHSFTP